MKSPLAHLSPTVLALGAAIGVSLSVFLLSGAALQGEAIPLLPALRGAAENVEVSSGTSEHSRPATPAKTRGVSLAQPAPVPTAALVAARPTAQRALPVHHARARARARAVRPAPSPPARIPVSAPAPAAPAPAPAPQPISAPKGKGRALGLKRGLAATPAVAPRHGNGRSRGHSPEHHHGLPPGQAKKAPAAPPPTAPTAPPKAKGGGPPAEHGGNGNGHSGGNGHKGDKK